MQRHTQVMLMTFTRSGERRDLGQVGQVSLDSFIYVDLTSSFFYRSFSTGHLAFLWTVLYFLFLTPLLFFSFKKKILVLLFIYIPHFLFYLFSIFFHYLFFLMNLSNFHIYFFYSFTSFIDEKYKFG